jgi:hypothetical protein
LEEEEEEEEEGWGAAEEEAAGVNTLDIFAPPAGEGGRVNSIASTLSVQSLDKKKSDLLAYCFLFSACAFILPTHGRKTSW